MLYFTSLLLLGLPLLHLQHGGFGLDYISQTLFHVKCSLKKRFHPSALLTGMYNGAAAVENGMTIPQKLKNSV